jgi:hypothetical protein
VTRLPGPLILATWIGQAEGSRAVAAALACAASDAGSAGLLIELSDERPPRPALIASSAARALEQRLSSHLPDAVVASRGHICHLALPLADDSLEQARAALPLVRETAAVVHLTPGLLREALADRIEASGVLIRADLAADRPLAALAVRGLLGEGLRVGLAKSPLAWVAARRALFGALPAGTAGGLPRRLSERLLSTGRGMDFLPAEAGSASTARAGGPSVGS